ncbi:hypothetical protein ACHAXS_007758 [Conticribra weissflogii]
MKFTTTLMLSSIVLEASATSHASAKPFETDQLSSIKTSSFNLRQKNPSQKGQERDLKKKDKGDKKEKETKTEKGNEDDIVDAGAGTGATQAPPKVVTTPAADAGNADTTTLPAAAETSDEPAEIPEEEPEEKGKADMPPGPNAPKAPPNSNTAFDPSEGAKAQLQKMEELEEESFFCHECNSDGVHICTGSCHYFLGDDVDVSLKTDDLAGYEALGFNVTNAADWKVGIFMKMAHPQQGLLEPIVSLQPKLSGSANLEGSVTFGSSSLGSDSNWPLDLDTWGTGFDVWLLDENGAEVLGPYPFTMKPTEEMLEQEQQMEVASMTQAKKHGILAHSKADHKETAYTVDGVGQSKAGDEEEPQDEQESSGTGGLGGLLGGRPGAVPGSVGSIPGVAGMNDEPSIAGMEVEPGQDADSAPAIIHPLDSGSYYLDTDKYAYSPLDPVTVSFDLGDISAIIASGSDITRWVLGIYMHMASPQNGALDPLVSLPLCGLSTCIGMDPASLAKGAVTFSKANVEDLDGSFADWPLDLNEFGTGYDVILLNENGGGMTAPILFTIPIEEDE